jgi:hypothetical protein
MAAVPSALKVWAKKKADPSSKDDGDGDDEKAKRAKELAAKHGMPPAIAKKIATKESK